MANAVGGKCARCGKNLKNSTLKYTSKGKLFCFDCYQIEASRISKEQSEQNKVFDYIKKFFATNNLPPSLVEGVQRLFDENFSTDDILYILRYVYEINGAEPVLDFLVANIRRYQQEAFKYKEAQKKLADINKEKNIQCGSVTIKIKKELLDEESKPKFTYKMEDL
jgi:hypothetical protein